MNLGNHHAAIHRLTHIVDCQKSHADSRHSFHLHTGFSHTGCPAGCRDLTGFLIEYKFNLTVCQCNNMAQRNQLRVLFRPHDSGDSRDTENIPLFCRVISDCLKNLLVDRNRPLRHRYPVSVCLFMHIHHHGISFFIKMCKSTHVILLCLPLSILIIRRLLYEVKFLTSAFQGFYYIFNFNN